MSTLGTLDYWRSLGERVARQVAQTALPIFLVVATGQTVDVKAGVVALVVAVVVTLLKALVGIQAAPGENLVWRLVDRAVPAAAGVLLGFVPVDLTGELSVDWKAAGLAALGAAVTAVLAYYVTPPSEVAVANATPDYDADNDLL